MNARVLCPHKQIAYLEDNRIVHEDGSLCIDIEVVKQYVEMFVDKCSRGCDIHKLVSEIMADSVRRSLELYNVLSYLIGLSLLRGVDDVVNERVVVPRGSYGFAIYVEGPLETVAFTMSSLYMMSSSIEPLDVIMKNVLEALLPYVQHKITVAILYKVGFSGSTALSFRKHGDKARAILLGNSFDIGLTAAELIKLFIKIPNIKLAIMDFETAHTFTL